MLKELKDSLELMLKLAVLELTIQRQSPKNLNLILSSQKNNRGGGGQLPELLAILTLLFLKMMKNQNASLLAK